MEDKEAEMAKMASNYKAMFRVEIDEEEISIEELLERYQAMAIELNATLDNHEQSRNRE